MSTPNHIFETEEELLHFCLTTCPGPELGHAIRDEMLSQMPPHPLREELGMDPTQHLEPMTALGLLAICAAVALLGSKS